MATSTKALFRGSMLLGASPTSKNVSNVAITSSLATITTNATHGYAVGDIVTIVGAHASIDGTYVIYTVPTTTTFTFVSTTATLSSAAVSPVGAAICNVGAAGGTVTNRVILNGLTTITTGATHGLVVDDLVAVTIGLSTVDTLNAQVIATPSTTTFCYVSATTTLATAAVSQGAWSKIPVLYTVPASTTAVVSNLVVSNQSSASATFSMTLNGQPIASSSTITGNSSAYFDLKQVLTTTQTLKGSASSPFVVLNASGVEIS